MPENPWYVDSIQEFSCFKCPECIFDSKLENDFQEHAVENHPLSFVLFGKLYQEEVFDESLIMHENKLDVIESYDEDKEVHETPIYSTESVLKDEFAESDNYDINEIDSKVIESEKFESSNEVTLKCPECYETFTRKHELKCHIYSIHEGKELYLCPTCDGNYTSKLGLNKHIKWVHEKEKPNKCPICFVTFYKVTCDQSPTCLCN